MATNDQSEASEPDGLPAKDLTDDVKRLLDQLAGQITDADQRHADSLQDMQARLAAMSDRAAAAKPEVPSENAEAFGRVEAAMATLANRLADAEPKAASPRPAADDTAAVLPDEVRAELRRAIAEGNRVPPKPASAWSKAASDVLAHHRERASSPTSVDAPTAEGPPASRYPYVGAQPAAAPPVPPTAAAPAIERAWLEDRFAEIADRVETSMARLDRHNTVEAISARFDQLEKRFAGALDAAPERGAPDAGALQGIEKQITGLFAELDRTRTQLGRLDTIESRLTELRRDPSDEQMTRLIRAASPTDAQLSAVAIAAAERVAERLSGVAISGTATPAGITDQRLGELITLMQEFIGEHRTGDVQTAEALDTMQQAMQHLIDRVEAIEAAQISGHDELMRAARSMPEQRGDNAHESLDFGFREEDIRRATGPVGSGDLQSIAVIGPAASAAPGDHSTSPRSMSATDSNDIDHQLVVPHDRAPDAPAPAPSHRAASEGAPLGASEPHRDAFIAMARRAAEKAAREPWPHPDDATTKDRIAGALGWARQLAAGGSASQARRPRLLLVASIAAFLLAGFWMLAGTGLRGMLPVIGSTQSTTPIKPASMKATGPADATPGRTAPSPERATKNSFPGMGRVVEGGFGITIDEGAGRPAVPTTLKPDDQVQLASLSEPAAQEHTPRPVALPELSSQSGPVEMPPATIGPLSLRHAAANGDALAQLEVASRFAGAKGVPQDFAQAATWYQRAASQGLANAQYQLGTLYDRGRGVAADPARARVWYGRAAEQGNVRAMHNLAVFSTGRPGVSQDYPLAVQWFTEAANHGLADSQYNLGILYESGLGVPTSLVEAYKWYSLAARSGDKDAIRRRDALRIKLEPVSVSAVDTLVIKWRAKPLDPAANDMRGALPTAQVAR
jgi:localization factor PodJL